MCDQTQVNHYKQGDVVWAKLGHLWWPGEVTDKTNVPEDILKPLKREPAAFVKFFNEEYFECVKEIDHMDHYNCERKNDFIKKGLGPKNPQLDKFRCDIVIAEDKLGGNVNILNEPIFVVEAKSAPEQTPKFKKQGKKSNKFVPHITHRRFLGHDDYESHILIQDVEEESKGPNEDGSLALLFKEYIENETYFCPLCNYKSSRMGVIRLHTEYHKEQTMELQTKKTQKSPEKKKVKKIYDPKDKGTKRKKKADKSLEFVASDEEIVTPKRKRKTKGEVKETPPVVPKEDTRNTTLDLINDWSDEETSDLDTPMKKVEDAEPLATKLESPSKESTEIKKTDKSCFEFDDDIDSHIITTPSTGRKIPRVIPPSEKRKSTAAQEEPLDDGLTPEERKKRKAILDESEEFTAKTKKNTREEDIDRAYRELLESTAAPALPEVTKLVDEREQNFHCAKTKKVPDKTDKSEKVNEEVGPSELKSDRESSVESNVDVNLSKNEAKSSKSEPKLEQQSPSELRTSKRARKPSYKALNDEAKWQRDEQKLLKDVLKKTTDTKSDEPKHKEPPKTPKLHHYPKTAEDELLSPVSNWDEASKNEPKSPTKKSFLCDNQDTGSILHEAKGFVSPPRKSPVKSDAKSPKKESIPENFPDKFFSTDYDIVGKSPPKPAEIPETSGAKPEEHAINSETVVHYEKTPTQREKSPAKREKSPVKTEKSPLKPEKSPVKSPLKREKSPEKPKPEIEKAQEVATKLTNPKKRFVKSFEDFELMQNEQKKQAEQQENKVLNSEIIFRPEKKQKIDTAGQEPNQNVAVYKLKSQIMSKINEESNKNQIFGNSPRSSQPTKSPNRRPSIESRRFSLVPKPEPKKEIPTTIKDVVKNLQQRSPNLKIHTINQTSSKAPISSYSKYKKTLTKEFDLKHGDQSKKIVIGPSSSKGFTTAKVISISKSKLSDENVITEMLEPEEVKEPIIPPRLEEPELVEIDGTIAVVSEKDLDNAQVEITTAPPQNSNPVTIMNFSMDFSENSQEGIDFKLKNIETKTLETKLSLESIQQKNESPKSNVFSMKNQESELVVNSEDIDKKIEPVAETPVQEIIPHEEVVEETIQAPEPEQELPLPNQTIEEPKTENDIQFVFDDSPEKVYEKPEEKTETPVQIQKVTAPVPVEPTVNVLDFVDLEDQIPSQIVVANKKPKEMMDLEQEIQPLQINKQDPKNVKKVDQPYGLLHNTRFKGMKKVVTKTYEAASKKPPIKNNKAIILSEKIIKPANSLSTTPPFKKVDPVIKKSEPQTKIVFNSDGKSFSPFRPKMLQKVITPLQKLASSGGKAKILNQTIITPSGEILQPKVSPQTTQAQAQTLQTADDVDFDINSMPIVLSDELLTPESIEAMPIVLNETLQTPKGSMHIKTAPKSTPQPPKILNKVYSTPKTAYSPSLLQHGRKIPKILQNSAQKFVKYSTSQATATPTGSKYIIVPTQTQTKVVSAPVTPQATMAKKSQFRRVPTATTSSVPLETGGNKVMIVTNQHGQQQRLLLTPDQQKLFGMDSKTPTRIVKSLPLQAQQKFIRPQQQLVQMARSAGVSPKFTPKMISPQTQMQVKGPLQKVKRLINQKITSKTGAPSPQKTILIKNQRGELVSRIQGTDDALLDKQVQEQLEAIKAGTLNLQKQQAAKAQAASSVGHKARSTPVKRIEHKVPPVKVQPPQPKVESKVPPLTPIKVETPKLKEAEVVVEAEAKKEETDVGKKEEPPTDRPLNQLVIQDNQGNQTTITEGQILALPSETVDGQPQSYMLVTLDETGNITPLNNEALMSLDPNLVGDLSNMVLQIDQNAVNITQPAAATGAAVSEAVAVEEPKKEEVVPEPQPEPEPEVVPEMTTANVHISYNMHSELGQQLMITGDPAVTQKLLDTLSEGNTDLATLLAGAEGSSSFIIQADGQQILINTETDSSMIPSVSTENEGNPVFATPNKNDILAAALADTDVLQQETQNKGIPSQLSPGNLYQINVGNVLETSLTLNSPIMTPLEVPSTNTKKIDDEADVLTQGPTKNVDLPITVTDPTIAHTVSQQQAALIAAAQAELAELSLPLTDHHEISTSGQFVYSLPSLDDSEEMSISSVAPSTISHSLASIGGSMMSINDMPILTDVTDNSETITDNVVTDNSTISSIETVDSFAVTTESSVATDNLEVADNHAILSDDFSVTHDAVLSDNLSIPTEHEAETSEASVSVDALPSDNLPIPTDNLTIPTDNLTEISEASTVLLDNANTSTDNSSTGDKFEHIADIYTDNSLPTNVETPPIAELSETLSDTVTVVSDHSSIEQIPTDNSDIMTSETLTTTDNSDLVASDNFSTTHSESFITTTTTDSMSTSDFVQTTTDNSDFMQTTFSNSMPLLTDIDEPSTIKATEEEKEVETPEELFKMQLTDDSNSNNTDKHEVASEAVGASFMEVDEGLCTLGGEMCSSLSEPPPEIFELPLSGAKENNFSSALGTDSSSDNSTIKTDDNVAMTDNSYTRTFTMESVIAAALETPMEHSLSTETTHGVDTLVQNAISEVGAIFSTDNDDSVEIPIQPEIVTTLESFENND